MGRLSAPHPLPSVTTHLIARPAARRALTFSHINQFLWSSSRNRNGEESKMGTKKMKVEDKRKPKHSRDANRPAKGGKEQRDAATVSHFHGKTFPIFYLCYGPVLMAAIALILFSLHHVMLSLYSSHVEIISYSLGAGAPPQNVQQDSQAG